MKELSVECDSCLRDTPVIDDVKKGSQLFVDSSGRISVLDKDGILVLRGGVKFCPECGRKFKEE